MKPGGIKSFAVVLVAVILCLFDNASALAAHWEWQHPLPQGNELLAVWGTATTDAYAVGDNGTILHTSDGTSWAPMQSGTTEGLRDVWGSSGSDIFAVGDRGTILHFNGTAWSPMASNTTQTLYAVWGSGPADVYATSFSGDIFHYNGIAWSLNHSDASNAYFYGIWGNGAADVWVVGSTGTILHFDGTGWSAVSVSPGISFTTRDLYDAWGDGTNLFIAANNGVVWRYDGNNWSDSFVGTSAFNSIYGDTAGDVFAVHAFGGIYHYNGSTWSQMTSGTSAHFNGVWGTASDEMLVVGSAGTILIYDSIAWTPLTASVTTDNLQDAWGSSAGDIFAVGDNGAVIHFDGAAWSSQTGNTSESLRAVWGTGPADVFALGTNGTIVHYDGGAWTPMTSNTTEHLSDVWGTSGNDVFAVGASGVILHYDGSSWSPMASGTGSYLYGVWAASPTDVYAVTGSEILHYDGSGWEVLQGVPAIGMSGGDIWGSGTGEIYVLGEYGQALHFDGVQWKELQFASEGLSKVTGFADGGKTLVYITGNEGVFHFDGERWQSLAYEGMPNVNSVWAAADDNVIAVGNAGAVLHYSYETFYVDMASGTDDPAFGGSAGAGAWKTLHYALSEVNGKPDGNYVLNIAPGTYSVATGEATGNPVITKDNVKLQGGAGVILDGEYGANGWNFGLTIDASNVMVEGLTLTRFKSDGSPAILVNSGGNNRIEGCTLFDNDRGVQVNNAGIGTHIVGCSLYSNSEGVFADDAGVTVSRNKVYDNGIGVDAVVYSDNIAIDVTNNLFYGSQANDAGVSVGASMGSVDVTLYHNTFVDIWLAVDLYHAGQTSSMTADADFNIIANADTGLRFDDGLGGTLTGPDHNTLFNCTTPYASVTPGGNDLTSDPLFVDGAAFDYHLQDGSPAKDAIPPAQNDPITVDLDGAIRPQGSGHDMGAYEVILHPAVVSVSPANGALGVTTGSAIVVTFSQPMYPVTFTGGTFEVRDGQGNVSGTYSMAGATATFTPDSAFSDGSVISVRLTTGLQGLLANGLAANYAWSFTTQGSGPQGAVFASQSVISTDATTAFSVTAADLDDDGDLDVLSASDDDNTVEWFSNTDGNGTFGPPVTIWDAAVGARSVFTADVTGDGILDVLSASWGPTNGANAGMEVAWYENAFNAQPPGNFSSQNILGTHSSPISVVAADLDNDGDMDVLSASYGDATVAWYENTDGSGGAWIEHAISTSDSFAWDVFAADLDNDGDLDVLAASNTSNDLAWYENRLNEASRDFGPEVVISDAADGARVVRAADVDQDGDMDVISASWFDGKIAWYENLGGTFGDPATNQKVIATASENTQAMHAADLDNDGDVDVLYASWGTEHKIYWMENDDGNGTAWTSHDISTAVDGCQSLYVADLDKDGDLDVLSASQDDNKIAWYENTVAGAGNQPPEAPVADDPPDEAVIGEGQPVMLDTSDFYDPDGDAHSETIWEVWRQDNGVMLPGYPLTVTDTEMTQHTIAESLEAGLKYGWRVGYVDADGSPSWSRAYFFKVGTSMSETLPEISAGQALGDFGMISIVHWPDDPSPQAVFAIDYDPASYRIGTWDPEAGHYIEFGEGLSMEPGKAYWILARDGLTVNFNGILVSRVHDIEHCLYTDPDSGYGWNMIAPPNAANYLWDYVMVGRWIDDGSPDNVDPVYLFEPGAADLIDQRIWQWENGGYKAHAAGEQFKLQMYKGYWVRALKSDVYLVFPVASQVAGLSTPKNTLLAAKGKAVQWLRELLPSTKEALADNDQPPMPMGSFDGSVDPIFEGCFVETLK